ncbi:MAG TPA: phytochrome sensor protein [Xanthomonadaceae bacterium]|nr:phytochrome sensor protein [Xanthomonadaceae bacterium]
MFVRRTRVHALFGVLLLGCTLACSLAQAGSFTVNPVRVTLSGRQPVAALTVRNLGDTPAVIQLEVKRWSQLDGRDLYEDTAEILATPPIFTVPANQTQLVRVGLRRAPDPDQELTYRLYLQEVEPPPTPGFTGLKMAVRMGVPLFVQPAVPALPSLHWQATRLGPEEISLSATNTGKAHIQLNGFQVRPATESSPAVTRQVSAYLLPGQRQSWVVQAHQAPGVALHLLAKTDAGDVETELAVGAQ